MAATGKLIDIDDTPEPSGDQDTNTDKNTNPAAGVSNANSAPGSTTSSKLTADPTTQGKNTAGASVNPGTGSPVPPGAGITKLGSSTTNPASGSKTATSGKSTPVPKDSSEKLTSEESDSSAGANPNPPPGNENTAEDAPLDPNNQNNQANPGQNSGWRDFFRRRRTGPYTAAPGPLELIKWNIKRSLRAKSDHPPPMPLIHPLAKAIYCMAVSHRGPRGNRHYVTTGTAVFIGDSMWLAPAHCFRHIDTTHTTMEIWLSRQKNPEKYLSPEKVANGQKGSLYQVAVLYYMDETLIARHPIPHDQNIDCRKDLAVLRQTDRRRRPRNKTAAVPGFGQEVIGSVTLLNMNQETPITEQSMTEYPDDITAYQVQKAQARATPGFVIGSDGKAYYARSRPERMEVVDGSRDADFIVYNCPATDNTPGGAIYQVEPGVRPSQKYIMGIHLSTCRHQFNYPDIPPFPAASAADVPGESNQELETHNPLLHHKIGINFSTRPFCTFAELIVDRFQDEHLRTEWGNFVHAYTHGELTPEPATGDQTYLQVPFDTTKSAGVWMNYIPPKE